MRVGVPQHSLLLHIAVAAACAMVVLRSFATGVGAANAPNDCNVTVDLDDTGVNLTASYINAALNSHNYNRYLLAPEAVKMPMIVWNPCLALLAQNYLEGCPGMVHSNWTYRTAKCGFDAVGENLAAGYTYGDATTLYDVVQLWAREKDFYTYEASCGPDKVCGTCSVNQTHTIDNYNSCGHYTQIMWDNTTDVGCAYKYCPDKSPHHFYACEYGPAGNYRGDPPYALGTPPPDVCQIPSSYWGMATLMPTVPPSTTAVPPTTTAPSTTIAPPTTTAPPVTPGPTTVDCDNLAGNSSSSSGNGTASCLDYFPECRYDTTTENCVFSLCARYTTVPDCYRSSRCLFDIAANICKMKACYTYTSSSDCEDSNAVPPNTTATVPPSLCEWTSSNTCASRSCDAFNNYSFLCTEISDCAYHATAQQCSARSCSTITSKTECSLMFGVCVWMFDVCIDAKCLSHTTETACVATRTSGGGSCEWINFGSSSSSSSSSSSHAMCLDPAVLRQPCERYGNNSICWLASPQGRCRMSTVYVPSDTPGQPSQQQQACVNSSFLPQHNCYYQDVEYNPLAAAIPDSAGNIQCPNDYCTKRYDLCFTQQCRYLLSDAACTTPGGEPYPSAEPGGPTIAACKWMMPPYSMCLDVAMEFMPCNAYDKAPYCPPLRCVWDPDAVPPSTSSPSHQQEDVAASPATGACVPATTITFLSTIEDVTARGDDCSLCEQDFCECMGGTYTAPTPPDPNATATPTTIAPSSSFLAPLASCGIAFMNNTMPQARECTAYMYNVSNCTRKFLACKMLTSVLMAENKHHTQTSPSSATPTQACKNWYTAAHLQALDAIAIMTGDSSVKPASSSSQIIPTPAGSSLFLRNTSLFDTCYAAAEYLYRHSLGEATMCMMHVPYAEQQLLLSASLTCFTAVKDSLIAPKTPEPTAAPTTPPPPPPPESVNSNITIDLNDTLVLQGYLSSVPGASAAAPILDIIRQFTLPSLINALSSILGSDMMINQVLAKAAAGDVGARNARSILANRSIEMAANGSSSTAGTIWENRGTAATSAIYVTTYFNFSVTAMYIGINNDGAPRIRVFLNVSYVPIYNSTSFYQSAVDYLVQLCGDWVYSPLTCPFALCRWLGLSSIDQSVYSGASPPNSETISTLAKDPGDDLPMWVFFVIIMGAAVLGTALGYVIVSRVLKAPEGPSLTKRLLDEPVEI